MTKMLILLFCLLVCGFYGWREEYNINAGRHICVGSGCPDDFEMSYITDLNLTTTIRDICWNVDYAMFITSDYKLKSLNVNSYDEIVDYTVHGSATHPRMVKLACTKKSFFALSSNGNLYVYGSDTANEFPVVSISTNDFAFLYSDVEDVVAGEDIVYIVKKNKTVYWMGTYDGSAIQELGDRPGIMNVSLVESTCSGFPRIQPVYEGVLFTYYDCSNDADDDKTKHYFLGKIHPSTMKEELVLTETDFSQEPHMIENKHPIDYIARSKGECGIIISQNEFYLWGECNNNETLLFEGKTDDNRVLRITPSQRGDGVAESSKIIDFRCNQECYILTEDHVYHIYQDKIVDFSHDEVLFLIPRIGDYKTLFSFSKPNPFRVHRDKEVNRNIPSITPATTENPNGGFYISNNNVYIDITKPETFRQRMPTINVGIDSTNGLCQFEHDDSMWTFKNERRISPDIPNTYDVDVYSGVASWGAIRNCSWDGPLDGKTSDGTDGYIIYRTKIFFEEHYFLYYIRSNQFNALEQFYLDIEVLFQKYIVIEVNINVQRGPFEIEWAVFEKNIDEVEKEVEILFKTKQERPMKLSGSLNGATNYYNATDPNMVLAHLSEYYDCDDFNCFQVFQIKYTYSDVEEIGCLVDTVITIGFTYSCDQTHVNSACNDSGVLDDVIITVNPEGDVCYVAQERIDLETRYYVFKDWKYNDYPTNSLQMSKEYDEDEPTKSAIYSPWVVDYEFAHFEYQLKVKDQLLTIENTVFTLVKFNEIKLWDEIDGLTEIGDLAIWTDDTEVGSTDTVRMQVKVISSLVPDDLNYGDPSRNVTVYVNLRVTYVDINKRRTTEKVTIKKYLGGMGGTIDVIIGKPKSIVAAVVTTFTICAILAVVVTIFFTSLVVYFCLRKRKQERKNQLVQLL